MEENPSKRSLRELLSKGEKSQNPAPSSDPSYGRPIGPGTRFKPRRFPWKLYGSIIVLVLVLVGAYIGSRAFATATLVVVPRQEKLQLDTNFTALIAGSANTSTSTPLVFEVLTLEDVESKLVPSTGTETVERKASGRITVFNDYSATPERLIANTRFEAPDGKIYRISDAIVIPGRTSAGPGSIEVTVTADVAGEASNKGIVDFTIPGLKGDARFSKIYARSKTEISGGFVGTTKVISEADRAKVRSEAHTALTARLKDKVQNDLPADYIAYEDATFLTFSEDVGEKGSATEAELVVKGTLSVIAFKEVALAQAIARVGLSDFDGSKVYLADPSALELSLLSKDSVNPQTVQDITFSLRGPATIVWEFNETELTSRLLGKSSKEYTEILRSYPAITRAEAEFSPQWIKSFPKDESRVYIEKKIGD